MVMRGHLGGAAVKWDCFNFKLSTYIPPPEWNLSSKNCHRLHLHPYPYPQLSIYLRVDILTLVITFCHLFPSLHFSYSYDDRVWVDSSAENGEREEKIEIKTAEWEVKWVSCIREKLFGSGTEQEHLLLLQSSDPICNLIVGKLDGNTRLVQGEMENNNIIFKYFSLLFP